MCLSQERPDEEVPDATVTFAAAFQRLYRERFTGSVLVDLGEGVPSRIRPLTVEGEIKLDKRPRKP